MNRVKYLLFIITSALVAFSTFNKSSNYTIYTSSYENVLGTSLDMKFSTLNEESADLAENIAVNEIKRLNDLFSSYDKNSTFSQWTRTYNQSVKIPQELKEVLQHFESWSALTNGMLSPAIAPLDQIWKDASKHQQIPSAESISEALKNVNQQHWILNANENSAIHLTNTPLLLNSFVKSYIINKAIDKVMKIEDLNGALINIGGDIVVRGNITEEISIVSPTQKSDNIFESSNILIKNKAIATSGNYKRGYNINGKHYSHIINPKTGMPSDEIQSATVIANDAVTAGALATAFNVLTVDDSKLLADKFADIEFKIITSNNDIIESKGWDKLIAQKIISNNKNNYTVNAKEKLWNPAYEATISIELARLEGFARRPFVAIWIVNSNNETVKNIALWFNKPRWLPDLREWYHQNYQNYAALPQGVFGISSATRPAGSYTFKWDGKDDKGELMKQGKYTVFIEAAREHGTYQIMKQEFSALDKEQSFNIQGNTEIANASVLYKKIQ